LLSGFLLLAAIFYSTPAGHAHHPQVVDLCSCHWDGQAETSNGCQYCVT
jgi:hypothetical protein